jgi:hypothetical protein
MQSAILTTLLLGVLVLGAAPARGEILVQDHGAVADGTTDDTAAIQAALDAAAADQGGVVFMPKGRYLVAGSLSIPVGVTLKGEWEGPHSTYEGQGTLILATGSRGDEDGPPLIRMNRSTTVRGMTILYPEQKPAEIVPYPWTIQSNGTHPNIIDMTLINPWKAIDVGTHHTEMHYIRNVYGQPLRLGIFIDQCTDIGRVENVHFNPNPWTNLKWGDYAFDGDVPALFAWLKENLVGFVIGKTDWQYFNNCFVIFPKIGFHFIDAGNGPGNAVLTQCGSDIGPVAVQVDSVQAHSGIAFVNSQIMQTVIVGPDNKGPVKFSNSGFWPAGPSDSPQVIVDGAGTVMLDNCHFAEWGWGSDAPAVHVKGGTALINGCDFFDTGKPQVKIDEGALGVVVSGSRLRGGERIVNNSKDADLQVGLNLTR